MEKIVNQPFGETYSQLIHRINESKVNCSDIMII